WMEGFNFETVIDPGKNLYKVKTREAGFNLLLGKRVDYFIDYEHNFLTEYKDKVDFVVLNADKKLFIAFQNTSKGRKLAALYDQNMLELSNSGALERIYGLEFAKSKLGDFNAH
ncbi:MAG: hypothetical protein ACSHXM_14025, partial [Paraglaciecola sp.]